MFSVETFTFNTVASRLGTFVAVASLSVVLFAGTTRAGEDPGQFVHEFGNQATAMLADGSLGPAKREQAFRRLLTSSFDVDLISRFVLGKHRRGATDQERAQYRQLFEAFIVATYSRRLEKYGGETLTVGRTTDQGKKGTFVASQIVRPAGSPINVTWRLRPVEADWRIIDVIVEGVSMAVTQRSEFDAVIRSNGGRIAGLLEKLRALTAGLETKAVQTAAQVSQSSRHQRELGRVEK